MTPQEFWLRLLMIRPRNLKVFRRLTIDNDVTHQQILKLLTLAQLTPEQKKAFFQLDEYTLATNLKWLTQPQHHLIHYNDKNYPKLLRHIADPPLLLFVKGAIDPLHKLSIAMVGSRNFSHYGKQWGSYFAAKLAEERWVITSGLALGIDSICHQAVIDHNGITIAVLGGGIQNISPRKHITLAESIIAKGGCIISEFLPTQCAKPDFFPRRNRIISGLGVGVLVVEAALKSGSLITARLALEQGREVFALPGPLGNLGYQGTHWLIQQGANLVTSPEDILNYLKESIHWLPEPISPKIEQGSLDNQHQAAPYTEVPHDEAINPFLTVLSAISDEVTTIDQITQHTELSMETLSLQLLELEIRGYIALVEGGYVRNRKIPDMR